MKFIIEEMRDEDREEIRAIYREGIATGNATFETDASEWEEWDRSHRADCRFVAKAQGQVLGWAAVSSVSSRRVYAGVAEVSVYVKASATGHGIGKALLQALVQESERVGIWTLQAEIRIRL